MVVGQRSCRRRPSIQKSFGHRKPAICIRCCQSCRIELVGHRCCLWHGSWHSVSFGYVQHHIIVEFSIFGQRKMKNIHRMRIALISCDLHIGGQFYNEVNLAFIIFGIRRANIRPYSWNTFRKRIDWQSSACRLPAARCICGSWAGLSLLE